MPLQSIEIENFRGVRSCRITLHRHVTVLFGSNAAGKSTILDALAIALGAYLRRVPRAVGRDFAKRGDIRVPWRNVPEYDERAGVESRYARLVVTASEGVEWDVTKFRSIGDRPGGFHAVGTRSLHEWLEPRVREALDAPPGVPTSPIPFVAAYGNERAVVEVPLRQRDFRENFDRFSGLDRALAATTRFKDVFEWFFLMEHEERRQQSARQDFAYRLPALEWIRAALSASELRCRNPRVETQPIRMLVDFLAEDGSIEALDIRSLSDGYRTHFALIVDIARRMVLLNPSQNLGDPERGTNSPALVLIDEVDLHLDPLWQGRVIRGLRSAFPNTQFVLTTHSEQVIASVEAECVRQLVWEDGSIDVRAVPFAQGSSGERVLIDLMGAPERVDGPVRRKLSNYLQLVHMGQGTGDQALQLRADLAQALPGDAALLKADLEIQRRDLLARLQGRRGDRE